MSRLLQLSSSLLQLLNSLLQLLSRLLQLLSHLQQLLRDLLVLMVGVFFFLRKLSQISYRNISIINVNCGAVVPKTLCCNYWPVCCNRSITYALTSSSVGSSISDHPATRTTKTSSTTWHICYKYVNMAIISGLFVLFSARSLSQLITCHRRLITAANIFVNKDKIRIQNRLDYGPDFNSRS